MFFTKEDRNNVNENFKLLLDQIPRINMLELHVKSLLSKNDDLQQKVYDLKERIARLRGEDIEALKKADALEKVNALEKKYNQDKGFLIETLKDIQQRHSNVPQLRLKKDGTPAKKRGRKPNKVKAKSEYLTLEQICEMTTLGKSTIYRWRQLGKFPASVKLGTKTVWTKDSVYKWMQEVEHKHNEVSV